MTECYYLQNFDLFTQIINHFFCWPCLKLFLHLLNSHFLEKVNESRKEKEIKAEITYEGWHMYCSCVKSRCYKWKMETNMCMTAKTQINPIIMSRRIYLRHRWKKFCKIDVKANKKLQPIRQHIT